MPAKRRTEVKYSLDEPSPRLPDSGSFTDPDAHLESDDEVDDELALQEAFESADQAIAKLYASEPTTEHASLGKRVKANTIELALDSLVDVTAHDRKVATVLNAYYADQRVARIFRSLPFVGRLDGYRDEARQRVAVMFFERYVDRMVRERQSPDAYYKLLYALAFNMLRTMRREAQRSDERHRVLVPHDEPSEPAVMRDNGKHLVSEASIASDTQTLEETERRIDMQTAQREIAKRLSAKAHGKAASSSPAESTRLVAGSGNVVVGEVLSLSVPPKLIKLPSANQGDVQVLLDLRSSLGLTNIELAEQLDCTPAALASYIGRRVPPPARIVAAAQVLLHAARRRRNELAGMGTDEIFDLWIRRLRIQSFGVMEQCKRIAEIVGKDATTVYRWRTQRVDIPVRDLDTYNDMIKAAAPK